MNPGDLIKHKRTAVTGIIIKIFERESFRTKFATVLFSNDTSPRTAQLKLLENNWEILNDRQE